ARKPAAPPPAMRSAMKPKRNGASASAPARTTVRNDSARPHSCGWMMSRRTASRAGLLAVMSAPPTMNSGTAASSVCMANAGSSVTPASTKATADTYAPTDDAPPHEAVTDRPAEEDAEHGADGEHRRDGRRLALAHVVLVVEERHRERLDAGEEEVADRVGHDHD